MTALEKIRHQKKLLEEAEKRMLDTGKDLDEDEAIERLNANQDLCVKKSTDAVAIAKWARGEVKALKKMLESHFDDDTGQWDQKGLDYLLKMVSRLWAIVLHNIKMGNLVEKERNGQNDAAQAKKKQRVRADA